MPLPWLLAATTRPEWFAALRTLTLNIRTLMVSGAIGAIALVYGKKAAILVFIYSLGMPLRLMQWTEHAGHQALMELMPKEAAVRRNGEELTLPVEEVQLGETSSSDQERRSHWMAGSFRFFGGG